MKKRRSAYWTLFNAVRERLLTDVVKFIKPGMLRESLGITPRRKLPHSETCAYERYWTNWFWEFSEINATVDRTDHVLIYLSHYPGSRAFRGLSEADWLRYHVEVYLQEIYVLNERLKRFLKKVEKISIAARDKSGIISIRTLTAHVDLALKNAVSVRGGHVHRCRFDPEELHQIRRARPVH